MLGLLLMSQVWQQFDLLKLQEGDVILVFRNHVQPNIHHPVNKGGGRWYTRALPLETRVRLWTGLVLAMLGENLEDNTNNEVCGVVLSVKPGGDRIEVFFAVSIGRCCWFCALVEGIVWVCGRTANGCTVEQEASRTDKNAQGLILAAVLAMPHTPSYGLVQATAGPCWTAGPRSQMRGKCP